VDTGSSQKMRPNKERAFSDEVATGSLKKMQPNKKLEQRSGVIGSKNVLLLA